MRVSSFASSILEISGGLILGAAAHYNENNKAGYAVALAAVIHGVSRIFTSSAQPMYFSRYDRNGMQDFFKNPENEEDRKLNNLYKEARVNTAKNVSSTKTDTESKSCVHKVLESTKDLFFAKEIQYKPERYQKTRFKKTAAVKTFQLEDPPSEVSEETETKEKISTKPSVCTRRRVIVDDDYT